MTSRFGVGIRQVEMENRAELGLTGPIPFLLVMQGTCPAEPRGSILVKPAWHGGAAQHEDNLRAVQRSRELMSTLQHL